MVTSILTWMNELLMNEVNDVCWWRSLWQSSTSCPYDCLHPLPWWLWLCSFPWFVFNLIIITIVYLTILYLHIYICIHATTIARCFDRRYCLAGWIDIWWASLLSSPSSVVAGDLTILWKFWSILHYTTLPPPNTLLLCTTTITINGVSQFTDPQYLYTCIIFELYILRYTT